jgi:phosphatidylinositol 4-phosphatase
LILIQKIKLDTGSYLMVIASRSDVGHSEFSLIILCQYASCRFQVFDTVHTVYAVKDVIAIPLIEERAVMAVNTLASRNAQLSRPSLLPNITLDTIHSLDVTSDSEDAVQDTNDTSSRVVQFLDHEQVKPPTRRSPREFDPDHDHEDDTFPSGASTPSSEDFASMSTVAKTLAARLSFWSRLSKRTSLQPTVTAETKSLADQQKSLDSIMNGKERPNEILTSILAATAPPPATSEERHSELEDKIVRECIREFTKGGMYFAYNFGMNYSRYSGVLLI